MSEHQQGHQVGYAIARPASDTETEVGAPGDFVVLGREGGGTWPTFEEALTRAAELNGLDWAHALDRERGRLTADLVATATWLPYELRLVLPHRDPPHTVTSVAHEPMLTGPDDEYLPDPDQQGAMLRGEAHWHVACHNVGCTWDPQDTEYEGCGQRGLDEERAQELVAAHLEETS